MKKWVAVLLAAVILFALSACGSSDADSTQATEPPEVPLTANGVTITLPEGYQVMSDMQTNESLIAAFSGNEGYVGIYVIRETLASLGKDASYTAADYLNGLRAVNERENLSEVSQQGDLPYFTYTETKESGGKSLTIQYLNVGYRSGENCYLVQFFCYREHYDSYFRDRFFRWAGTVTFS